MIIPSGFNPMLARNGRTLQGDTALIPAKPSREQEYLR
ncbi:MAG: hypothetical protein CM1200mP35_08750 [Chloroflexota bacterium]|nr:MAG: hypothetical protein CM1200mP35_08750 [Chloroflexota bacterium]